MRTSLKIAIGGLSLAAVILAVVFLGVASLPKRHCWEGEPLLAGELAWWIGVPSAGCCAVIGVSFGIADRPRVRIALGLLGLLGVVIAAMVGLNAFLNHREAAWGCG